MLTTFYFVKNDHRWVTFICLRTIHWNHVSGISAPDAEVFFAIVVRDPARDGGARQEDEPEEPGHGGWAMVVRIR